MKAMKSFTLIEVITAITISGLILSGLAAIFSGTIKLWSNIQDDTNTLKGGIISMQWLKRDIMEKKIVDVGGGYIEFSDGTE